MSHTKRMLSGSSDVCFFICAVKVFSKLNTFGLSIINHGLIHIQIYELTCWCAIRIRSLHSACVSISNRGLIIRAQDFVHRRGR
ncbi:hypothetical protein D3C72_1019110 [compost metagenome]